MVPEWSLLVSIRQHTEHLQYEAETWLIYRRVKTDRCSMLVGRGELEGTVPHPGTEVGDALDG